MTNKAIVKRARKRLRTSKDSYIRNELVKWLFFYDHGDNNNQVVIDRLEMYGDTRPYDEGYDKQIALL